MPRTIRRFNCQSTFAKPKTMPTPTPNATLPTRSRLVNLPPLRRSTVSPKPQGSRSMTVATKPATKPKAITINCPNGPPFAARPQWLSRVSESRARGSIRPDSSPSGTLPRARPTLKTKSPRSVARIPFARPHAPFSFSRISTACTSTRKPTRGPTARQLCQSSSTGIPAQRPCCVGTAAAASAAALGSAAASGTAAGSAVPLKTA
mmetsp:Transcript_106357/g.317885  ORF Transcript_106357/g.317885 Transcript_106357/m.317885 type:complete len:206 (+) Transcript_106357:399-1016(+)